jgi:hypothetical protein
VPYDPIQSLQVKSFKKSNSIVKLPPPQVFRRQDITEQKKVMVSSKSTASLGTGRHRKSSEMSNHRTLQSQRDQLEQRHIQELKEIRQLKVEHMKVNNISVPKSFELPIKSRMFADQTKKKKKVTLRTKEMWNGIFRTKDVAKCQTDTEHKNRVLNHEGTPWI